MSLKRTFKEKYGVDLGAMIERFNEKKDNFMKSMNFAYDVTGLDAWTDNTLPSLTSDLIANSEFLDLLTLETGVKGTREIALLNSDVTLQARVGCATSPDGSVIFTKEDLTTKLLYAGVEFCNEDLNTKMTQILNVLGVKRQNGQLPADIEDILMAYLGRLIMRKAQRLVVLGDTTSLDAELALMDGLIKKIEANVDVVSYTSLAPTITPANGYDIAYGVYKAIPTEVIDNGIETVIVTGRQEALEILEQWNTDNPYSQVEIPNSGSSMRFRLPLTSVDVITIPELNGLNKMFAMPLSLVFLGIDDDADMDFEVKYDAYEDTLKAETSFRLGTQLVWGQYFVKLVLTAS